MSTKKIAEWNMDVDVTGVEQDRAGVKVVVKGLATEVTRQQLLVLFRAVGVVRSAHVVLPAIGPSSGFGYVYMKTEADAENAAHTLNRFRLHRMPLSVEHERSGNALQQRRATILSRRRLKPNEATT